MFGTGGYGVGGNNAKDGGKDKGNEEQEGEEGEKQGDGCEQEEEQGREDEEPTNEEARKREGIKNLPKPLLTKAGNVQRKSIAEFAKGEDNSSSNKTACVRWFFGDRLCLQDLQ